MLSPSNEIEPLSGASIQLSRRESVDLPQPDSPTMPKFSPAFTSKVTPRTASTSLWPKKRLGSLTR